MFNRKLEIILNLPLKEVPIDNLFFSMCSWKNYQLVEISVIFISNASYKLSDNM